MVDNIMGLKDLQKDKVRFCNIIDVVNKLNDVKTSSVSLSTNQYGNSSIIQYDNQIIQTIEQESITVKLALEHYYDLSDLEVTPYPSMVIASPDNSGNGRLVTCEVGEKAVAESFILTFTSSSGYTVEGVLSGAVGSGDINSKFTSDGDGDIIIDADTYPNIFSGSFESGDKIYIGTNKYHRKVASVTTYIAAGEVMRVIAHSNSAQPDEAMVNTFINHGKRERDRLTRPYDDDGYDLGAGDYNVEDLSYGDWEKEVHNKYGNKRTIM